MSLLKHVEQVRVLDDEGAVHGTKTVERLRIKAEAAYQDFLTLWKDADPDIPILRQAKAEWNADGLTR